jgi:hypothetical protein
VSADSVVVVVPGERESLRVLRLVASDMGRTLRLPYDEIDDVRLAVSEAAAMLIGVGVPEIRCTLRAGDGAGDGVVVSMHGETTSGEWPPPRWSDSFGSFGQLVLSRIAKDLTVIGDGGIRFRVGGRSPAGGESQGS